MNRSTEIRTNLDSSRIVNIVNKESEFSSDLSSASDNDSITVSQITTHEPPKLNCCLICSILCSLSNVNCCRKHLALLTKGMPAKIVYMMPPALNNGQKHECPYQSHSSKSKRRPRSCSSTASTEFHHRKRKRSIVDDAHNDGFLLSPNTERDLLSSDESRIPPTNDTRTSLSSSLQSSFVINTNMTNSKSLRQRKQISSTPMLTRSRRRSTTQTPLVLPAQANLQQINNQSTSSDLNLSHTPRILLNRIALVKDDDEELSTTNPRMTLNMAQATEQMTTQRNVRPKILLKRVRIEK